MSGIAGIIHWNEQPVEARHLDAMLEIVRHRGPQGLRKETSGPVALGHALLVLEKAESEWNQPLWLRDRSAAIVADARLYNRAELTAALGPISWFGPSPSDAAILLAAYERWQEDFLPRLDGDFALVIWDARRRRILAARDPFGVKPLVFRNEADRFAFGSEAKQILLLPGVPVEPDDQMIGEYLFNHYQAHDHTFFHGVRRVRPAHYLVADATGDRSQCYWRPEVPEEIRYSHPEDYFRQFRGQLKRAVEKRLRTDFPVAAELSGGLDSPSIVAMAAAIYQEGSAELPPLETVSARYGDLDCDESGYIRELHKRFPFRGHFFDPVEEDDLAEIAAEQWDFDGPIAHLSTGDIRGLRKVLARIGARILLTGVGGDEILTEGDYIPDLVSIGRYRAAMQRLWRRRTLSSQTLPGFVWSALRLVTPQPARRLYRAVRRRGVWQRPAWAQPAFAERFREAMEATADGASPHRSQMQQHLAQGVVDPRMHLGLDILESRAARSGVELRHAFLDRELIAFVLSIPFEERLPLKGQRKRLARQGLAADLPAEILERDRKTVFDSYLTLQLNRRRKRIQEDILVSAQWLSAPYVDQAKVMALFGDKPLPEGAFIATKLPIQTIANVELWLRRLSRYQVHKLQ
jgi:asparagine synthase (glutamine-hydrolysing)